MNNEQRKWNNVQLKRDILGTMHEKESVLIHAKGDWNW